MSDGFESNENVISEKNLVIYTYHLKRRVGNVVVVCLLLNSSNYTPTIASLTNASWKHQQYIFSSIFSIFEFLEHLATLLCLLLSSLPFKLSEPRPYHHLLHPQHLNRQQGCLSQNSQPGTMFFMKKLSSEPSTTSSVTNTHDYTRVFYVPSKNIYHFGVARDQITVPSGNFFYADSQSLRPIRLPELHDVDRSVNQILNHKSRNKWQYCFPSPFKNQKNGELFFYKKFRSHHCQVHRCPHFYRREPAKNVIQVSV